MQHVGAMSPAGAAEGQGRALREAPCLSVCLSVPARASLTMAGVSPAQLIHAIHTCRTGPVSSTNCAGSCFQVGTVFLQNATAPESETPW